MKTAIISGVSGQDGYYLSKLLIKKGYKVIGVLRHGMNKNIHDLSNQIIFENIALTDFNEVKKLIIKYTPNEFYNLAAESSVSQSFMEPLNTFNFNTGSFNNIVESIRLFSPKTKLYNASSSEMYGRVKKLPIKIDSPMQPLSPYGVSKMASFFMATTYRESYNLYISNGVLFNHESSRRSNNFFIKKIITSAIAIKEGKKENLRVGNIDVKRDFGYAPAYVEAIWKILQVDKPNDFIICSGLSIKLRDIIEYVFHKLKINTNLIIEDKDLIRPNEIKDIYGDNSKSKKILDWNYDISFYDILDILIEEELQILKIS